MTRTAAAPPDRAASHGASLSAAAAMKLAGIAAIAWQIVRPVMLVVTMIDCDRDRILACRVASVPLACAGVNLKVCARACGGHCGLVTVGV